MVDKVSKETRSRIMGAIRSKHTKLEDRITKELWHYGIRFRKNVRNLRGTPDIAIIKYKVVIFIDSCFWHACKSHGHIPKSNSDFWINKFNKNLTRDIVITNHYKNIGWNIIRIWEHEVQEDFGKTIDSIVDFIYISKRIVTREE
ncbi:MAG TPA: very short patch repair endonuclease [Bacilli bacterium]